MIGWFKRGYRVNRALLAQHIAREENNDLIFVNQTFWKYEKGALGTIGNGQIRSQIHEIISEREDALGSLTSALVDHSSNLG